MPKWMPLVEDIPLQYNPYQVALLDAIRKRLCPVCRQEYARSASQLTCPRCDQKGMRVFDRLALISGRRGGKTRIGAIAAVEEACIPNTVGWAMAPTNPKLHRYIIPAFQKLIPPEWVANWSAEFLDLRLKNGSLIHFQTLEHPDQGRGQGLDWGWIDEASELSREHWDVFSPSLIDRKGVAFITTSPRGFDWVYDCFWQEANAGTPGFWAARYKTSDNPIISEEELARERATKSPEMYRQEYEADFVTFQGAVYGSLVDPQVLYTTEAIQALIPEWPAIDPWRQVLVGIDTGADHPFGALKLVSTEKGLVAVGEYLEKDSLFAEHATRIRIMAMNHLRPGQSLAIQPRWALNKNERQGTLELAQHGIYAQGAENDVVAGIERVKSWLHARQLFFVADRVPKTIMQMKTLRWADNYSKGDGQALKEKVYKKNDELPDCCRYALMTWPVLPTSAPITAATDRDISQFTPYDQDVIRRLRKTEREPKENKNSIVGDFWL